MNEKEGSRERAKISGCNIMVKVKGRKEEKSQSSLIFVKFKLYYVRFDLVG